MSQGGDRQLGWLKQESRAGWVQVVPSEGRTQRGDGQEEKGRRVQKIQSDDLSNEGGGGWFQ